MNDSAGKARLAQRWWIYQRERFPLASHGILIAAFSFCAVSFSHRLRGATGYPRLTSAVVAFATSFTFFLQLRIADEFKDYEEDLRYRPYRPVQRGVVSLRELAALFVVGAALQLALALWLDPRLVALLAVTWIYLAAMSKEFFVREWLKEKPLTYMVSHMAIMPLIDLYATASDWLAAGATRPPVGLAWFLVASFFNGMVIEIGRKIRSPADEETGVGTYSAVWGLQRAVGAWWLALGLTAACATMAAGRIGAMLPVAGILSILFLASLALGVSQVRHASAGQGKRIERYSGIWTILMYLSLGLLPLLKG